ncbi:hypothetical protein [Paenibacillus sp. 1P03SA]|uniref:hypothetical protein n=1 Tax=Paenibacillus sp. 1P03SA TaxID=3132294 RepID=UPI0039A2B16D
MNQTRLAFRERLADELNSDADRELLRHIRAQEAEIHELQDTLMYVYQAARNDVGRWDGGACVGLPVFLDRVFARWIVREGEKLLFPAKRERDQARLQLDIATKALRQLDDRRQPMLPRSQMARIAKTALDQISMSEEDAK